MASSCVTAMTVTRGRSAAPDPLIGRVIADRFRITSLIARGGMGKVYKAEQAPLGRLCAIKVLNPSYNGDADPEFHRRFFREASITSRIAHPNSVTIFDYGKTDDDIFYMAMEFLDGQTLHQALREAGTMHEDRVGRIMQQICRALREAHALDVIHRDLKPANIFLMQHGDEHDFVKVLDFGLVKHLSERPEEQLTQTGLFMGSPKYMAPEQIQGGDVDARTDVYSLGIMMYEMLAGKVPFERSTSVNILMAHVGEPPPLMREVNPNLVCTPGFEEVVMRCLAKDPAQRYRSMDAVLQAIKQAHGVSLTGQLAAVSTSGVYPPIGTVPPPPVHSSVAPFTAATAATAAADGGRPSANSSGMHAPMGEQRTRVAGSPDATESGAAWSAPAAGGAVWIGMGVLVAAVLGGLLGMAAFRVTSPSTSASTSTSLSTSALERSRPSTATSAPPTSAGVKFAPGAATTSSASSVTSAGAAGPSGLNAKTAALKVTSDPPGASVREDTNELCAATPCDIAFKEAGGSTRAHKLLFTHPGFRPEMRISKAGDPPLQVRLWRAAGIGGVRPPVTPLPPASTKPADAPNGFKELPY